MRNETNLQEIVNEHESAKKEKKSSIKVIFSSRDTIIGADDVYGNFALGGLSHAFCQGDVRLLSA